MSSKKPFLTKFAKPAEYAEEDGNASKRISETIKTKVGGETTDDS